MLLVHILWWLSIVFDIDVLLDLALAILLLLLLFYPVSAFCGQTYLCLSNLSTPSSYCLSSTVHSALAWTRLMRWGACLCPACVVVDRHIGSGTARWLPREPSNNARKSPEMAIICCCCCCCCYCYLHMVFFVLFNLGLLRSNMILLFCASHFLLSIIAARVGGLYWWIITATAFIGHDTSMLYWWLQDESA